MDALAQTGQDGKATFEMILQEDKPEENADVWQKQLTGLHWYYPVKKLRAAAVPLLVNLRAKMGDEPMPVMASHYFGKGQVVFMGTDETWRWRWNYQDKYFVRFWGQIIYQLGLPSLLGDNARRVQMALDRSQATLDHVDAKDAKARTSKVTLIARGKDRPGEYTVLLPHDRPGRFELKVNNPELHTFSYRVDVPPGHELADAGMAEDSLRKLAVVSGGRFYREEDLHRLPDDILTRTVTYRDRQDVMLYPLGLVLFVLLITGEWLVRKFSNLS